MKNKKLHEKILAYLSIFLILAVLFNLYTNTLHWSDGWTEIFWYCDIAAVILAIGILFKKTYLFSGTLIMAIPAQLIWIFDFILKVLGFSGFGRTELLFSLPFTTILTSIIIHIILIPIAIYSVIIYGFDRKGLWVSLIFSTVLLLISFFVSPYDSNINCVFYPCDIRFEDSLSSSFYFTKEYLLLEILKWGAIFVGFYFILLAFFKKLFKSVEVYR